MKSTALAFLLVLASCGEYKVTTGESNLLNLQPRALTVGQVSLDVSNAVSAVCTALNQKAAALPSSVSPSHSFSSSQSDCDGNKLTSNQVIVTIQGNATSGFVFRKADGMNFLFPDVETAENGIFEDICASQGNLQNPILSGTSAKYFGLSTTCAQVAGETCLEIVTATINGTTAQPHTREMIRVRTRTDIGKVGFWTFRERVTKSFCSDGKTLTLSATLK